MKKTILIIVLTSIVTAVIVGAVVFILAKNTPVHYSATEDKNTSQPAEEDTKDIWGYPYKFDANFKSSCMIKGGSPGACACGLQVLKEHYAYPQALEFDRTGQMPQEYYSQLSEECNT